MGRVILVFISMYFLEENRYKIYHMLFYLYIKLGLNWHNRFGLTKKNTSSL